MQFGNETVIDNDQSRIPGLLSFGDVNEDGDMDLITSSAYDSRVAIYTNLGNGAFSEPKELSKISTGHKNMVIDDVNFDGNIDLLFAGGNAKMSWFENKSNTVFDLESQKVIKPRISELNYLSYRDLNGDDKKDIIYMSVDYRGVDMLQWIENIGNGNYKSNESTIMSSTTDILSFAVGDYENDGDNDLFVQTINKPVAVYLNNGNGQFTLSPNTYEGNLVSNIDPMVDIDGDGMKDIYLGRYLLTWYKNLGNSNFEKKPLAVPSNLSNTKLIDFDKDGDLDIIYSIYQQEIGWLENDGNQVFTKHTIYSGINLQDFYPLDINQDGNIDIIWDDQIRLMWQKNSGSMTFSIPSIIEDHMKTIPKIQAVKLAPTGVPQIILAAYDFISIYTPDISSLNNFEPRRSEKILFYPNPVKDIFCVELSSSLRAVEIYNMDGRLVHRSAKDKIDISFLKKGVYLLKLIDTQGKISSAKLIKE